ncbi:KH domain-containing protein [Candidatus Saccharibacteria bacterium]|nr:KH domain-containing protein [Candidatus Saccharibacteria bacterium]
MATIDQQFVEYIVKTLVNNPDKVAVERKIDEKGVLLSLTVAPEDVGRVIGKRGVTAQAIRVLLRALGTKQDARFNLKIVNTDEGDSATSEALRAEPVAHSEAEEAVEAGPVESLDAEPEEVEEEETSSELAEKTRAELADLDDLDI